MAKDNKLWQQNVANAICAWLRMRKQRQSLAINDKLEKLPDDPNLSNLVLNIFNVSRSKAKAVEEFFNCIYDEEQNSIDIENSQKLDNKIVWNILESFLEALGEKGDLDKRLENYFTKVNKEKDNEDVFENVDNGRQYRNEIHEADNISPEELIEVWRRQLLALFLLTVVENEKQVKTTQRKEVETIEIGKLGLWFAGHKNLYDSLDKRFAEAYLGDINTITQTINKIIRDDNSLKVWKVLLSLINDKGDVCEAKNIGMEIDFSTVLESFLFGANHSLYNDTKEKSWDANLSLLQKLTRHVKSYDNQVFRVLTRNHDRIKTVEKTDRLSTEEANIVDNHFLSAAILIGALCIAIKKSSTGVVYYSNNNISVLPFKKATRPVSVSKFNPYFNRYNTERLKNRIIYDVITASVGDFSIEEKIKIEKGRWSIIIFDFPPRQEGTIKEIINNIKFPGVIDYENFFHAPGPTPEPEPVPEPIPETKPEPKPTLESGPAPEPTPEPKPESKPTLESGPAPEPTPEPERDTKPIHEPKSEEGKNTNGTSNSTKWFGLTLAAILVVCCLLLLNIYHSGKEQTTATIHDIETTIQLESKSWIVTKIDGRTIGIGNANAEIRSSNSENSEYLMIILTDYDYFKAKFYYDSKTGRLSSPELGDGIVERTDGNYNIHIKFYKGWELQRAK